MTAIDLVPLLAVSASGGQSQSFMPFVLLAVPLVLAALLLFFLGRQRRRNRDHEG
jgi:hypothetical protein